MSLRVVIVDDEKPARDRIRRLLRDHPDLEVIGEAADVSSAVRLIDESEPDLVFLDVQIPGGEGFDVLTRVARIPRVVFTTAYDQYAVRAFDVNSIDYLLKPFDRKRFAAALERVRDAVGRSDEAPRMLELLERLREGLAARVEEGVAEGGPGPERIAARRGARILLLDPSEVYCFEAEDTLVYARTRHGRFMIERTLSELEDRLEGRFFRTHRGYLVNLAQIGEILPDDAGTFRVVLRDSQLSEVPLSRRQARKLRERIPW